ncbi:restriction endonuclease [Luteimonas sp. 3794]|uniref:restriction endonuclease n=1 Tax=Luteimonas sp. 3794 TaxID=2817730 RepID=UPI00285CDB1A|nr:restriction endonuclease [Luteimonas sp. 3794]MDR6990655.1 hypothetical protein [Luteimonas sp. 3794]
MAGRRDRRGLQPVENRRYDRLSQVSPSAFEQLIADHYRKLGYSVERVGHGGAHFDGGIDLKLRRGSEYILVQCKRENAYKVTHNVGHELLGVMCTQGATSAIVVNTGEFTPHAQESARGDARLTLVDGDELRQWFPELATPSEVTGAPVLAEATPGHRRSKKRGADSSGIGRFAWAAAALAVLMVWQCSRPAPNRFDGSGSPAIEIPKQRHERVAAEPAARVASNVLPATTAGEEQAEGRVIEFRRTTDAERADWERRNAEAMRVLEATTPEL